MVTGEKSKLISIFVGEKNKNLTKRKEKRNCIFKCNQELEAANSCSHLFARRFSAKATSVGVCGERVEGNADRGRDFLETQVHSGTFHIVLLSVYLEDFFEFKSRFVRKRCNGSFAAFFQSAGEL